MDISYISSVLSNPTWDLLTVFFFVAAGFFYGLSAGKTRLIAVLFGVYIAILLSGRLGAVDVLTEGRSLIEVFLFRAGAFLLLTGALSYMFVKTIFRHFADDPRRLWWQIFILSFLEAGLLISFIFQLLPAKELFEFSPIVKYAFASSDAFFWWLVLPLIALFVIMRRK